MSFKNNSDFEKIVQQRVVVPQIYNKIWKNPVIESDLQNTELARMLDYSGIDKIIRHGPGLISGLSQRIQRKRYVSRQSLTIREVKVDTDLNNLIRSEFEKTKQAIDSGMITAAYQSHFYANANEPENVTAILCGVVVKRLGLWEWMDNNVDKVYRGVTNPKENGCLNKFETFLYVNFRDLPENIIKYRHLPQKHNNCNLIEYGLE